MKSGIFFDSASTTRCDDASAELVRRFANESYGNPSSSHAFGQEAAQAIRDARVFFANSFGVEPSQVVFTGSGSEADNMAVYGVAMDVLASGTAPGPAPRGAQRVVTSAVEHPAIRGTVQSLVALGFETEFVPVDANGQIKEDQYLAALTPNTRLVSLMQVNNIVGSILPVEKLAAQAKKALPNVIFHTDAIQGFGKIPNPVAPSPIDLVSISGHKVHGPKGVGALIVMNQKLLKHGLRPLVWGGLQEGGLRSGTQNAGLIAAFHVASRDMLARRAQFEAHARKLRDRLRGELTARKLLGTRLVWNSPEAAVPHIVSLSVPGFPSGPLAKLLEERGCIVSTGSACSSQKVEPDHVLTAMGLASEVTTSSIRISFCETITEADVVQLGQAFSDSIDMMARLLGIQ